VLSLSAEQQQQILKIHSEVLEVLGDPAGDQAEDQVAVAAFAWLTAVAVVGPPLAGFSALAAWH